MPTIRIMSDGRPILASPGQMDRIGIPVFKAGGGNTVKLTLDYTAFLGSETYDSGSWSVANATFGAQTQAAGVVSTLLILPEILLGEYMPTVARDVAAQTVSVVHRLVTSSGRIQNTPVRFWLVPATGTDVFILDGSYLV